MNERIQDYLHIVVDNFQKGPRSRSYTINHFSQCRITECFRDTTGVDCTHGEVRSILRITFYCTLYSYSTTEDDVDKRGDVEHICYRSEGRIFTQRMACKCTIVLHETLDTHIFESSLLCDDKGNLCKLSNPAG